MRQATRITGELSSGVNMMETPEEKRAWQRTLAQYAIQDAIGILDSAPVRPDLVNEIVIVQLMNRLSFTHLVIETGLKALIIQAGGALKRTHSLVKLCGQLKECDSASAEFLARAFQDAVKFYGYNVNREDFKHYHSLAMYLSQTGTDDAFSILRYWLLEKNNQNDLPDGPNQGDRIFYSIAHPIQRELLCAIWHLFFQPRSEHELARRETVSERVEFAVKDAMFNGRKMPYSSEEEHKKQAIDWYLDWSLSNHASACDAFEAAMRQNFAISDQYEYVNEILRDAYQGLQQLEDPAIKYYLQTLGYLLKQSEQWQPGTITEFQWSNADQTLAKIVTPGRTTLGYISKLPDDAWAISKHSLYQSEKVAWQLGDAIAYLVNRYTKRVEVTVEGQSKQFRIITEKSSVSSGDRLVFWNANHGLSVGDEVSVMIVREADHDDESAYRLTGTVAEVQMQMVKVTGIIEIMQGSKVAGSVSVWK